MKDVLVRRHNLYIRKRAAVRTLALRARVDHLLQQNLLDLLIEALRNKSSQDYADGNPEALVAAWKIVFEEQFFEGYGNIRRRDRFVECLKREVEFCTLSHEYDPGERQLVLWGMVDSETFSENQMQWVYQQLRPRIFQDTYWGELLE